MKEYKAVAESKNINVAKGDTQSAFNMFANIINDEATNGWEYHSMETISVTEKACCFQQPVLTYYYMLILVKEMYFKFIYVCVFIKGEFFVKY